ncbi:MAG: hypothetical protein FWC80_04945 [Firmicutes bacterium]|nr:hypothetical protein [Bacillota bacterium]
MEYISPKRKIRFSRTQKRIIIALNVLILAIAIPLLVITFWQGEYLPTGGFPPSDQRPYERLRDARMSLNPAIDWEINIGGTGSDIPSAVVNQGSHFHIFGMTTSTDFDFQTDIAGQKLSMATLTTLGRTQNFVILDNGPSINVVKALNFGQNRTLLLYSRSDTAVIARVACDGTITHSFERPHSHAVDFIIDGSRIILVVSHERGAFDSGLTVFVLNENLALDTTAPWHTRTTNISNHSLAYNSIFPWQGNYLVFAMDTFNRIPVAVEFGEYFNPQNNVHNLSLSSVPDFVLHDVVPFVDGATRFMMTGIANGAPHLIAVKSENNRYMAGSHTPLATALGISGAIRTEFLMVDNNIVGNPPELFVFAASNTRSAVRRMAKGSTPLAPPSTAFDGLNTSAFVSDSIMSRRAVQPQETLLFGSDFDNNLFLTRLSISSATPLLTFGGQRTDTAVAMTLTDRGVIIVAATNSDTGDVSANFGGIDTWVALIPL